MDSAEIIRTIIAALSGAGVIYAANRGFKSEHNKNTDAHTMALIDSGLEVHVSALAVYKGQLIDCSNEIKILKERLNEVTRQYDRDKILWDNEARELRGTINELKGQIRILEDAQ